MKLSRSCERMLKRAAACALLAIVVLVSGCTSKTETATKEGVAAATAWLQLLDQRKYDVAWDNSDDAIKGAGPQQTFVKMMQQTREPLGRTISRKQKDVGYAKDPQNAPPGEYVQMHFATSLENAKNATETVIVKKQADGSWKVGQYSINPE